MNTFSHVPPGFRFHPTDEELVDYYLRKKIASKRIDLDVIKDVDLYRIEPWDLQELCRLGTEEQNEWYFFSHKDKKYPTGTRTNRATKAGFWKATGRDKAIYARHCLVGMRKTLVFYKGRAPNGQKSDWIMHEYRLETNENATPQEEGWVVCRVFKKRMTTVRKMSDYDHSPCNWYDDHVSTFMPPELYSNSPRRLISHQQNYHNPNLSCKQELELHYINNMHHDSNFLQLPQLESPNKAPNLQDDDRSSSHHVMMMMMMNGSDHCINVEQAVDQVTDWRVLDKFVASQLSHEDVSKDTTTTTTTTTYVSTSGQEHVAASVSASSCQIDLCMQEDELGMEQDWSFSILKP